MYAERTDEVQRGIKTFLHILLLIGADPQPTFRVGAKVEFGYRLIVLRNNR